MSYKPSIKISYPFYDDNIDEHDIVIYTINNKIIEQKIKDTPLEVLLEWLSLYRLNGRITTIQTLEEIVSNRLKK